MRPFFDNLATLFPILLLPVQDLAFLARLHTKLDDLDDQSGFLGLDQQSLSAFVRSDRLVQRFIEGLVFSSRRSVSESENK